MSGNECYKCGKSGHYMRDCPEDGPMPAPRRRSGGRGGGGSSECFKCHETGHFARDCPNTVIGQDVEEGAQQEAPRRGRGRGGGGRGRGRGSGRGGNRRNNRCFKCNMAGHFAQDCDTDLKRGSCYNCGATDHLQRECTQPLVKTCFNCGQPGHIANVCQEPPQEQRSCYNCRERGHISTECTKDPEPTKCFGCQEEGHFVRDCPNKESKAGGADGEEEAADAGLEADVANLAIDGKAKAAEMNDDRKAAA